jgi:uncharacterized protein YfdQ (DUF2303 family)
MELMSNATETSTEQNQVFKSISKHLTPFLVQEVNGVPVAVVEREQRLVNLKSELAAYMPKPDRIKKAYKLYKVESLVDYVNRFKIPGTSMFFNPESQKLVGVIDFSKDQKSPAWGEHVVIYQPETTKEWCTWLRNNEEHMEQDKFIDFLEKMIANIIDPTGSELLGLISEFKVVRKAVFSSVKRTATGEFQFTYNEDNTRGTIAIPEMIKLAIAPFKHSETYELKAALSYSLREGGLKLKYRLLNPERVIDDAFEGICNKVIEGIGKDVDVFYGAH